MVIPQENSERLNGEPSEAGALYDLASGEAKAGLRSAFLAHPHLTHLVPHERQSRVKLDLRSVSECMGVPVLVKVFKMWFPTKFTYSNKFDTADGYWSEVSGWWDELNVGSNVASW